MAQLHCPIIILNLGSGETCQPSQQLYNTTKKWLQPRQADYAYKLENAVKTHTMFYPNVIKPVVWSEITLNYWIMMERYPNLKEEVGSSNTGCENSSLSNRILPSGHLPPVLKALACLPSVSKTKLQKKTRCLYFTQRYIVLKKKRTLLRSVLNFSLSRCRSSKGRVMERAAIL